MLGACDTLHQSHNPPHEQNDGCVSWRAVCKWCSLALLADAEHEIYCKKNPRFKNPNTQESTDAQNGSEK